MNKHYRDRLRTMLSILEGRLVELCLSEGLPMDRPSIVMVREELKRLHEELDRW